MVIRNCHCQRRPGQVLNGSRPGTNVKMVKWLSKPLQALKAYPFGFPPPNLDPGLPAKLPISPSSCRSSSSFVDHPLSNLSMYLSKLCLISEADECRFLVSSRPSLK